MLGFLNSIVLPLLAAVSIPLIIHFLNKQKTKEIKFSSIRFLKLIENKRIKRLRIYQILLIVIRMLFLLFLILAFARPTLKQSLWHDSSTAHTTVVCILDDSFSMQALDRSSVYFMQAKKILKEILSTFDNEDKIYLLLPQEADSNISQIGPNIDLNQYKVSYTTSDFSATLKQAESILQSQVNFNRELYFISDFMINESLLRERFPDLSVRSYLVKLGKEELYHNVGIDSMYLNTNIFEAGKMVEVRIVLHNYSPSQELDVKLDLFSGNNRAAMEHFYLKGNEIREVALNYIPEKTGIQFLQAELSEDDLDVDNTYYMNYLIPETISLLLVDDSRGIYLNTALQTLAEKTVITFEKSGYTYFQGKDFNKYDIIILNDPKIISRETMRRLDSFLDNNKTIFIIPGDNLTSDQLNKAFNKKLFLTKKTVNNSNAYFSFNRKSIYQELFEPVFTKYNKSVDLPRIKQYFRINPVQSDIILSLENGDSFLSKLSNSGLFLISSPFLPDWNDFALKGLFVPMLYRIIYAAVQHTTSENNYLVGKPIKRVLTGVPEYAEYILEDAKGGQFETIPEQASGKEVFHFENLLRPGSYKLFKKNKLVDAFSVNLSSLELRPPYVNMEKIIPHPIWLNPEKDPKEQILKARTGQELWFLFLVLSLLMLILEIIIIKKIEGKNRS